MKKRSSVLTLSALAGAAFIAACGQVPTSPTSAGAALSPSTMADAPLVAEPLGRHINAAGDSTTATPETKRIKICKVGNVSGTFTIVAAPLGGGTPSVVSSPYTVAPGTCRIVAEDLDTATAAGANITITETSAGLQSIAAERIDEGVISSFSFANGGQLFLNAFHGYTITFTNNVPPPPPPTGDKGCTPGYWKQPQHFDSWPGTYTPATSFDTAFGIGTNWFPTSFTLLDALGQNGGGTNALARHAAAALLNAASGFYPLTPAQVIARVQATYSGTYAVEATKDYFAGFNEATCPLN